jgi:hypothetical protein
LVLGLAVYVFRMVLNRDRDMQEMGEPSGLGPGMARQQAGQRGAQQAPANSAYESKIAAAGN